MLNSVELQQNQSSNDTIQVTPDASNYIKPGTFGFRNLTPAGMSQMGLLLAPIIEIFKGQDWL